MDVAVGRGIHFLVIDAVENAKEVITPRTQERVKFLTKGRRQYFLSVALADSGDGISEEDAAPHDIDDICQFHDLWIEEPTRGDARHFEDTVAKDALIGQVMDGVGGGGFGEERVVVIDGMHPVGNNARLPIITMDDIGRPVQGTHRFKRGAAEEDESFSIIGIAVDVFAIKVAGGINHVNGYALTDASLEYAHLFLVMPHVHRYRVERGRQLKAFGANLSITRHHQPHIVTEFLQRLRQCTHHIGQSSNLGKRYNFGSKDQNS